MKSGLLDLFSAISGKIPLVEWLDSSAFSELLELDIPANHYWISFHVEDKFAHAPTEGSCTDLYHLVLDELVHPDDRDAYRDFMNPTTMLDRLKEPGITGVKGVLVNQMRFKTSDGNWRWVEMCLVDGGQYGLKPGVVRFYSFDIQVQKDRFESNSDDTFAPLPNRESKTKLYWGMPFFDRATALFKEVSTVNWCIIAIDLEHFNLFNEWYGRDTGDRLLTIIGKELADAEAASGGLAGYLGQDDFCLLAPYNADKIAHLYERISGHVAELATAIGFRPTFGVSVDDGRTSLLELFDQAQRAIEFARNDARTDIILYDPAMRERDAKEYRTLIDFQRGLQEKEFIVYLQPQCRISTGKIVAVEALARWVKPDGEIIPPDEFVPILEKHGFVTDLDCFVWDHLLAQMRIWLDEGHQGVPISVNVSRYDFYSIDVPAHFAHLLEKHGIPASLLKVEITESAFVEDDAEIVDSIKRLRDMGLMVLMDDFGSGYSSLNRLGGIEVDGIKLDAGFFHLDEAGKRKGIRIVESVVNMSKTMALPIICEGVETAEQVEFLENLGCRYIQGYYYFRPMPLADFKELIADDSMIDERGFMAKTNEQLRLREFLDENVYSDTMLNTILGPVAYYLWHDDTIDIIRFNEQFYEAVSVPDFEERLTDVARFVPPDEVQRLFDLFEKATTDPLNGASDVIGFYGRDGRLTRFIMRVYYLGENDEGKRFYGYVRDVTDVAELQIQLKMLSNHLSMSIVFMRRIVDEWKFILIVHGLADKIGLSYEELQAELNDGRFLARIDETSHKHLMTAARNALDSSKGFSSTLTLTDGHGEAAQFWLEADRTADSVGEGSFFLTVVAL